MLTIALEPEAAAIFVKHLPVDRRFDGEGGDLFKTFAPGSKYIVVDAGGMYAGMWQLRGIRHSPLPTVLKFHFFSIQVFFRVKRVIGSSFPSVQPIRPLSISKNFDGRSRPSLYTNVLCVTCTTIH